MCAVNDFMFSGSLPVSKSLLNRALVVLSHNSDLRIIGDSQCDDVLLMQQGLIDLLSNKPVECGDSATVFLFLALRASRMPGTHIFRGSERLFSSSLEELMPILGQLGVEAQRQALSFVMISRGWRLVVDGLQINAQRSSQFASAVILNSWGLKFPLHLHVSRKIVSEGYLGMTLKLVRQLGMRIEDNGVEFFIPAKQKSTVREFEVEIDLSSAFAVSAMAIVAGEANIKNFPLNSMQPDMAFVQILKNMEADIRFYPDEREFRVKKSPQLKGVRVHLEGCPDLLPILGVLCAIAQTTSEIMGVGHLKFKESSRVEKTKELLEIMGAKVEVSNESIRIEPSGMRPQQTTTMIYNTGQDHRLAMAATVAAKAGYPIQVTDLRSISKSFPEFIQICGAQA